MSQIALSLLAGGLSAFSPCVLPTFPLVAGGALQKHRWGPVAVAIGMILSFTAVALAVNGTGAAVGLDGDQIRYAAAALFVVFGIVMVSSKLRARANQALSPIASGVDSILRKWTPSGLKGQFLVGALLGAVWIPCAGPVLGAALTMASQRDHIWEAGLMMAVFGVGASIPLLLVAYGSRKVFSGKPWLMKAQQNVQLVVGVLLLSFGVTILTGLDKSLEAVLVDALPEWFIAFTTKY